MEKLYSKALFVGAKAGEGEGQRLYTFRATTEAVDRQGEIVTADGWDFSHFEKNPVILDSHNYGGIENIVGRGVGTMRATPEGWEVDILFNSSPKGRLAQQLVDEGNLNAVSVGFASAERKGGGREALQHTRKELLEISVVPIPANREALRVRAFEQLDDRWQDMLADVKAGRVLSKANEARLRAAAEAINEVLAALGGESEGKGQELNEGTGLVLDGEGLAVLRAFAGKSNEEGNNA